MSLETKMSFARSAFSLLSIGLLLSACGNESDVFVHANRVCSALNNIEMVYCEVNAEESALELLINTSESEARKMCPGISEITMEHTSRLRDANWKAKIFLPSSSKTDPVAVCRM